MQKASKSGHSLYTSPHGRAELELCGTRFSDMWHSNGFPAELKIIRNSTKQPLCWGTIYNSSQSHETVIFACDLSESVAAALQLG